MIDAKHCIVYTDKAGREETPAKYAPETNTAYIPANDDYEPSSFLEESCYIELPDGKRLSVDDNEVTVEMVDSLDTL